MARIAQYLWTEVPVYKELASIASAGVPNAWVRRRNELAAIRAYRDDWDGFGADAPDPRIVDTAIGFLHLLQGRGALPPTRVTLSPDGLVSMEWQDGDHLQQAQVVTETEVEWMEVVPGRPTEFNTEAVISHHSRPLENDWQVTKQPTRLIGAGGAALSYAY